MKKTKAIIEDGNIYIFLGKTKENVHNNINVPTNYEELKESINEWGNKFFVVYESCTNYPLINVLEAESETDALNKINERITKNDSESPELLEVSELDFEREFNFTSIANVNGLMDEEEAWEYFANNSHDFAANAKVEEVTNEI